MTDSYDYGIQSYDFDLTYPDNLEKLQFGLGGSNMPWWKQYGLPSYSDYSNEPRGEVNLGAP